MKAAIWDTSGGFLGNQGVVADSGIPLGAPPAWFLIWYCLVLGSLFEAPCFMGLSSMNEGMSSAMCKLTQATVCTGIAHPTFVEETDKYRCQNRNQ